MEKPTAEADSANVVNADEVVLAKLGAWAAYACEARQRERARETPLCTSSTHAPPPLLRLQARAKARAVGCVLG